MQTYSPNKYHLVDLHKEISLYDRKIAYCQQFEKFDSDRERSSALGKLQKKRSTLVKLAMSFSSQGIEHDPKFFPRSLSIGEDGTISEIPWSPAQAS
ncbi:hypothetical protein Acid345_0250 [Candidatus Koribacter versatilis Ellin345]|uniref:Uncharacterized protein n=1 Tax=Koribacter versatilis (strain Ellin345) TaxID=204669 RepID=Q1IV45_KORVE|nr:hypothetical protein [Candidatus Koribacter versatilis]ABF39255.1 hypothetical protein Acid345_0250 [Candidatus Koribacter versatilis Ellin345]